MEHPLYFNTNQNINYRQRSQTLQPIRRCDWFDSKKFMIEKYFTSMKEPDPAKYANVPMKQDESQPFMDLNYQHRHVMHHLQARPPHALHSRSNSRHYYHARCQVNDPNNYYNLSNIGTIIPRSSHPSPHQLHEHPPPNHNHAQFDSLTIMQVCNEFGNLDSPPPMPPPRNYTVTRVQDGSLFKVMLPHRRTTKFQYTDHTTGTSIPPDSTISVLAPSRDDRSKFSICVCIDGHYRHIDMPHQLTQAPSLITPWNHQMAKMAQFHALVNP